MRNQSKPRVGASTARSGGMAKRACPKDVLIKMLPNGKTYCGAGQTYGHQGYRQISNGKIRQSLQTGALFLCSLVVFQLQDPLTLMRKSAQCLCMGGHAITKTQMAHTVSIERDVAMTFCSRFAFSAVSFKSLLSNVPRCWRHFFSRLLSRFPGP